MTNFSWPTITLSDQCQQQYQCFGGKSIRDIIETTRPSDEDDKIIENAFENIRSQIQNSVPSVTSIIKTGSFARGTHIRGNHDVDVAIFIDYTEEQLVTDLDQLEYKHIPETIIQSRNQIAQLLHSFGTVKTTGDPHLIKLQVDATLFDIVIAPDISPDTALSIIKQKKLRGGYVVFRMLTSTLSKNRLDVYINAPDHVKDLVRVAKFWIKQYKWTRPPLSFSIETLVLEVCVMLPEWTPSQVMMQLFDEIIKCCNSQREAVKVFGTDMKIFLCTGTGTELAWRAEVALKELNRASN
jgi:hypothetical protein